MQFYPYNFKIILKYGNYIVGGNGEQLSSFKKISMDKLFDFPSEPNLESMTNHGRMVQSEPLKLESQKSTTSLQNAQVQEHESESLVTLTSNDETPLTSRKESKSDLKKYIKMVYIFILYLYYRISIYLYRFTIFRLFIFRY